MSSILTNNSAMVALQTLKSINKDLAHTQNAISTGKDISGAKDNSSIWAISKVMESDVSGFKAVADSLALGESTVAVALAGAEQITDILKQIKEKVVAGTGENVDHTKLTNDVTELTNQITSIIGASQFNGMNLLDDDGAAERGAMSKRISDQSEFVGKVMDAMKSGIGSLVDADMEAASAGLQALQTQQRLGVQALAIANQATQTIMQLFR